jgi:hypothetical protein
MDDQRISRMMTLDFFTKRIWKGFLAPDLLLPKRKSITKPELYFVNTAPTSTGGEHWCVLIIRKEYCEFFDSFGKSPEEYALIQGFVSHCKKIKYNADRYQSFLAKTCGHHCIFFSMMRARGIPAKKIKRMYKKDDFRFNDAMVFRFVLRNFGRKMARVLM